MKRKNSIPPRFWAIIPAAGVGSRIRESLTVPKQYYSVKNKPIIEYTLTPFLNYPFEKIIVLIHKTDTYWANSSLSSIPKVHTTQGGKTRTESVLNGLHALEKFNARANDWIVIHDAVRPCLTLNKLTQFIHQIKDEEAGGLMAIPVRDTLKYVVNNNVQRTIPRENVWQAQTPQMFRYAHLYDALKQIKSQKIDVSDEAAAIEKMGHHPKIICGESSNIKVTYAQDVDLIDCLLGQNNTHHGKS